jgi:hypothetical protein
MNGSAIEITGYNGGMRILVTGDRNWRCEEMAQRIVQRLIARHGRDITIVHGACSGVDMAFDRAAILAGVSKEPHPADWTRFGKQAGPRRNAAMVNAGADLAIAVHRDIAASKGTRGCACLCLAAGIPTWLVSDDSGSPTRLTTDDPRLRCSGRGDLQPD